MNDFRSQDRNYERAESKNDSESFSLDFVSNATIAKILIDKGICTRAELVNLEQKYREFRGANKALHLVQTDLSAASEPRSRHENSNWLKRKMSKYRWSRSLGTFLFGWKWRKTKIGMPGQIQPIKDE